MKGAKIKEILIGITGGIAAYKVCSLVSKLVQNDFQVRVAMTPASTKFISPMTFASLSGQTVITDPWIPDDLGDPQHIRIARNASVMLIAPCSMNMIGKLASGIADDPVSLLASARSRPDMPTILAPSMNTFMLEQPSTIRNLKQLEKDAFVILKPDSGWQACRTHGKGRLPEPEALYEATLNAHKQVAS